MTLDSDDLKAIEQMIRQIIHGTPAKEQSEAVTILATQGIEGLKKHTRLRRTK